MLRDPTPLDRMRPYGFVAAFFLMTILPLIALFAGVTLTTPVQENRTLAAAPHWTWPPDFTALSQQADRWFTDHFGLRSLLIRLKTQIDLSVFRTSNRVHIGSDGWLFYRSVMDLEKPSVEDLLGKTEPEVLAGIEAFGQALSSKGIRLIIASNLLADRFVPDKLPRTVPRLPSSPRFDHFLAQLATLAGISYLDTPAILKRTQQQRQIFHKTDFHWNDPAAFDVARELVELIAHLEGREAPIWRHELEIETRRESGGIAMFMPVFFPPSEEGLFTKRNWPNPDGYSVASNVQPFETVVRVSPHKPTLLPATVVLGDSFFDGIIRSGFDAYFNEMYRIRWSHKTKISDLAAALPASTRYVVVQFIEVSRTALLDFADRDDIALAVSIIRTREPAPH
jgi:hypothetical protein